MKEDNGILLDMIRNKKLKDALDIMEKYIQKELEKKLDTKINQNDYSFMEYLDFCIENIPSYYDILTYTKNLYFFSEKTDAEKLNELINIYKNLIEYNI